MAFIVGIPVWLAAAAGVFIVIKLIFRYLDWLFYDKDKTLKENVYRAWEYLSQHSYFEIIKFSLARLYERLSNVFQKKIRFLYLFILFFFLNIVSILAGDFLFDFNVVELNNVIQNTYMSWDLPQYHPLSEQVDLSNPTRYLTFLAVFAFQLSLLAICSFLFTVGIIYRASKSKKLRFLIIELILDISILASFSLVVIFCSACWWLMQDILTSIFGSFFMIYFIVITISMIYLSFRYSISSPEEDMSSDSFAPLLDFLFILIIPFSIMSYFSIQQGIVVNVIFIIPVIPITLFWVFIFLGNLFKLKKQNIWGFIFLNFMPSTYFIILLYIITSIFLSPIYLQDIIFGKLPYLLSSYGVFFKFLFVLLFSSAIPTLLHLIAISVAIIAKITPKIIQRFINRHLDALARNEKTVLSQLSNACGGIAALITATIMILT